MIQLYTAATPNGRKVSIALEEIGLPYQVQAIDLSKEEQLEPGFLKLNPNHKIPVIIDDGLVVWESGAILLYLAEKSGQLLPKDPAGRMAAIQYAFFQTGGIGPSLGRLGAQLRRPEAERNAEVVENESREFERLLGAIERLLSDGREYLAGDYSIGDIMHFGWLDIPLKLGMKQITDRPTVRAWLERIAARPAVQRGLKVPS